MSTHEYFRCIDRAARATAPQEVRELRAEVLRRWQGDPRADDLAEALYAHLERLAGDLPDGAEPVGQTGLGEARGSLSRIESRITGHP
jgi:hypothetical protein